MEKSPINKWPVSYIASLVFNLWCNSDKKYFGWSSSNQSKKIFRNYL